MYVFHIFQVKPDISELYDNKSCNLFRKWDSFTTKFQINFAEAIHDNEYFNLFEEFKSAISGMYLSTHRGIDFFLLKILLNFKIVNNNQC